MTTEARQITGRCLCGNVTYSVDAEPFVQAVCHCADCQRQTGTAYSVVLGVPRAALTVEGDKLASFKTVSDDSGTNTVRQFCSGCGSPIVSLPEGAPDFAFIKAGTLDDASWLEPAVEVWTSSAQSWTPQFEGSTRFERSPG